MNRAEKTEALNRLTATFQGTPHVILTDFRGLAGSQSTELRRKIRAAGGSYRVVKNRLAKRAASGSAVEMIKDRLRGPCGLASHATDPVVLARVLTEFAKENPQLRLLAGVVDARMMLETEGIKALSTMPGLPELRAQLLGLIQTPARMLVRILNTPGGQVVQALDAWRRKLEDPGHSQSGPGSVAD